MTRAPPERHAQREACTLRFAELERRINGLEPELRHAIQSLDRTLSELKGKLGGYVVAASVFTGAIVFALQYILRK